jgi:histidinol-phosphate aminotransferase
MRILVAAVVEARSRLADDLTRIGFRVVPSSANFLLCEVGPEARSLGERLMDQGLVVRMYPGDGPLGTFLRFTVRSPDENSRLVAAIERLGNETAATERSLP